MSDIVHREVYKGHTICIDRVVSALDGTVWYHIHVDGRFLIRYASLRGNGLTNAVSEARDKVDSIDKYGMARYRLTVPGLVWTGDRELYLNTGVGVSVRSFWPDRVTEQDCSRGRVSYVVVVSEKDVATLRRLLTLCCKVELQLRTPGWWRQGTRQRPMVKALRITQKRVGRALAVLGPYAENGGTAHAE